MVRSWSSSIDHGSRDATTDQPEFDLEWTMPVDPENLKGSGDAHTGRELTAAVFVIYLSFAYYDIQMFTI
jgi:hypothetical protein